MAKYIEVAFNIPVKKAFTYRIPDGFDGAGTGTRVSAPFGKRFLNGYVIAERDRPPDGIGEIRDIKRFIDSEPLFGEETLACARWMADMYMCSLGEALAAMLPGGKRESRTEEDELPLEEESKEYGLAESQLQAAESISSRSEGVFYLYGVTGSGKTDVFLRVSRKIVEGGRGVIYLVPEISLTHQIVRVFGSVFGDRLAVLHSGLTPSQRLREWKRVRDGGVDVAIGARSAVFAPFRSLGLIVIDEEHEGSYKSGSAPRYHARQVAMYRASREKAVLLMGSATPSIEAYHRMQEGRLESFHLKERLGGGGMPDVEIVDMRRQSGPFSTRLIEEIGRTTGEGRQVILFLNRRGFSYFFHCKSCGYQMTCRHCSVSLTYHRELSKMICHYCGFAADPIRLCPECGSMDVGYSGFGTEGIEGEIEALFPKLIVRRIDADAVRKRAVLRKSLLEFRDGRVHVLVGTQMVAKGLNFPGVKLVGIVNADTGFQLPDFRAAERTFGLLVQVSGRAGRSLPDGKVLIQTFQPENPVIVLATRGAVDDFYAREIEIRRHLKFPPFSRLIRVVLRGRNKVKTLEEAGGLAAELSGKTAGSAEILGPAECPISRISGSYRFHVIVRAGSFSEAHAAVTMLLDSYRPPSGIRVEVDVDPQALL
jgi:primosomal protein N' (replication factor Y)